MRRTPLHLLVIPVAALAITQTAGAQSQSRDNMTGVWALTNARIETVTKGTIERGTVVIRLFGFDHLDRWLSDTAAHATTGSDDGGDWLRARDARDGATGRGSGWRAVVAGRVDQDGDREHSRSRTADAR